MGKPLVVAASLAEAALGNIPNRHSANSNAEQKRVNSIKSVLCRDANSIFLSWNIRNCRPKTPLCALSDCPGVLDFSFAASPLIECQIRNHTRIGYFLVSL